MAPIMFIYYIYSIIIYLKKPTAANFMFSEIQMMENIVHTTSVCGE